MFDGGESGKQLKWFTPDLLAMTDADDRDVLHLHETKLTAEMDAREDCIAEMKAHLQKQKYSRDRVRSRRDGQEHLQLLLVSSARTHLATLIKALRLASARTLLHRRGRLRRWRLAGLLRERRSPCTF